MTWLPLTRLRWLRDEELYRSVPSLSLPEAVCICRNVDWLIERCYEPDPEIGASVSGKWLRKLGFIRGLRDEAINWGDLGTREVQQSADGSWEVVIEEASPDCPMLCNYIEEWLTKWGWQVRVRTEW